MSDYILRDLQRRLSNIVRRGRVHSVDFSQTPARVKVEYSAGAVTAWLPFVSARASQECSVWEPLSIGEQVIILSESGDLNCGIVIPSIACADNPSPSADSNKHITKYSDGTQLEYDRASSTLKIDVKGMVNIICKTANVEASGDVNVKGANIKMNDGAGVVTGECVCPFTGSPHSDFSSTVFAGK